MARGRKIIPYKRKKEGKTDYKKRLTLMKSKKPRLVVRKSLKNVSVQIIDYNHSGDKVLVGAHSRQLEKLGWKGYRRNVTAAYLTGLLCGVKALEKGIKNVVLDSGLYISSKGSLIYAALKGAVDAGLNIPHGDSLFPDEKRIKGSHLKKPGDFDKVKKNILGGKK